MLANLGNAELHKALMKPPGKMVREHHKSYLFAQFSYKNQRRIFCSNVARYAICTLLEGEPQVRSFNEAPHNLEVPCGPAQSITLHPLVASDDGHGEITIHLLDLFNQDRGGGQSSREIGQSISEWTRGRGLVVRQWTTRQLQELSVYISNLELILRFISIPGRNADADVRIKVIEYLEQGPITAADLIAYFPAIDPEVVKPVIADLIVQGRVEASLKTRHFNMQSLLSLND